jgi:hypothetical protein
LPKVDALPQSNTRELSHVAATQQCPRSGARGVRFADFGCGETGRRRPQLLLVAELHCPTQRRPFLQLFERQDSCAFHRSAPSRRLGCCTTSIANGLRSPVATLSFCGRSSPCSVSRTRGAESAFGLACRRECAQNHPSKRSCAIRRSRAYCAACNRSTGRSSTGRGSRRGWGSFSTRLRESGVPASASRPCHTLRPYDAAESSDNSRTSLLLEAESTGSKSSGGRSRPLISTVSSSTP